MSTQYGYWQDFCRDSGSATSTIPVCNLFDGSITKQNTGFAGGCTLTGVPLSNGRHLTNLGSIILDGIAILVTLFLLWRTERKRAAVGRREMQVFLIGYIIISICEIFTIGGFPLDSKVRIGFSAVHIAAVTTTSWILLLNGLIGYQILDDGTPLSVGLVTLSSVCFFVGTGYIALDTGFDWTGFFNKPESYGNMDRSYPLYTLFLLVPLVFISIYFLLESYLVLRVLGERRPMLYLLGAALLFAISQIFQFVISVHLCTASSGAINGGLFETLFVLLAVFTLWTFWSSITEDDWPMPAATGGAYT